MKKVISIILALVLAVGAIPMSAAAATNTTSLETIENIVGALGIIAGDENGNLNLNEYVTRAQFAKIVVSASNYKDTAENNSTSSMFKDLPYTHWSASYVKIAADNGWVYGYLDGSFRPDNTITLQETVSVVLKLLGYTSADYSGAYPEGALLFYDTLGLSKNITAKGTGKMTRLDCMYLIYNALNTKTKSGGIYAQTLGYSLNASNEIDYSSVINKALDGPIVVKDSSWTSEVPFSVADARVYRNDVLSSYTNVTVYDAVYYSKPLKTLWVYSDRVSGIIESISPNKIAPTSVTVGGNTYKLDSSASYELSTFGSFTVGSSVTLVLGKDGNVLSAMSITAITQPVYGVVISTGIKSYTDSEKNSYSDNYMTMVATDGSTYQYTCSDTIEVGDLVSVSFASNKVSISEMSDQSRVYGLVNEQATKIGNYKIADNIQILDVADASYVTVLATRLANVNLKSGTIRYVAYNSAGEISKLILDDVTGDMKNYGALYEIGITTSNATYTVDNTVTLNSNVLANNVTYSYILGGKKYTHKKANGIYSSLSVGPIAITGNTGNITSMASLIGIKLTQVNEFVASTADKTYTVSPSLVVYEKRDGQYYEASLSLVQDTSKYTLTGYYDKLESMGGRIRVVVAVAK